MAELLIARNPAADSALPFLLLVPVDGGLLFRTKGTWPRTNALYCYPVDLDEWPDEPDLVERIPLRSCVRRGSAIDVIADRARESRSQLVFTTARGRDAVFWQAPRTRKQARPSVRLPTARAGGRPEFTITVDSRKRYGYSCRSSSARPVPCRGMDLSLSRGRADLERRSVPGPRVPGPRIPGHTTRHSVSGGPVSLSSTCGSDALPGSGRLAHPPPDHG